jgi:hypothetical protein
MPPPTSPPNPTLSSVAAPSSIVQEVFLTPRVLDAGTFATFSATLRELLTEADDRRTSLTHLSTEVSTLRDSLRALTTELESKLLTAVKVLPAIDQRLAKVNDALTFAQAVVKANVETTRQPLEPSTAMVPQSPPSAQASSQPNGLDLDQIGELQDKLGLIANDLRGVLETTARAHILALEDQAEATRSQLTEHAHTLEADSRSRLEGLLTAMIAQAVQEQVADAQRTLEIRLDERVQTAIEESVERAIKRALPGHIQTSMQPHLAAMQEASVAAAATLHTPDPTLATLRQQVEEFARWARSVDTLLSDHSGLVAAQSAHSALAQLANQAAGLGQHLESLTRRAEMTAHTLAGLMAQLPTTTTLPVSPMAAPIKTTLASRDTHR